MDNYKTISRNTADIQKYLKCYFNYDFPMDCTVTTAEIFDILKDHMTPFNFGKYLSDYLCRKSEGLSLFSPDGTLDRNEMIKFCIAAFKENGLTGKINLFSKDKNTLTAELLRKQVRNWFEDVTPSRESVFLLAFALKMSCDELSAFLTQGIREKELNYKNPAEVAAYACLKNGQDYAYLEKILNLAEEYVPDKPSKNRPVFTYEYQSLFDSISTGDKLIKFIAELIAQNSNPKFSVCIKTCYDDLLDKINSNAIMDKKLAVSAETGVTVKPSEDLSFGTIERYIYYYIPVKTDDGHYRTDTYALYNNGNILGKQNNLLKNSKWFFSTLLRRSDLKKMYDGEKPISRDTILTLAFLNVCEENPSFDTYEYIAEINDYLNFCRYEQINFSYPYDLFIFMCLQTDDPLASFRKVWEMSWIK